MTRDEELLLEQVTGAHRERHVDGTIRAHPAWHDLDDAGREEAFEATLALRKLEAALDENGFSSTVRALLSRIK
ncbi:MAG: hypothetical protein Q8L48_28735 [Archangium sp.]|nr:hypothetical protein [Archangium sp.]